MRNVICAAGLLLLVASLLLAGTKPKMEDVAGKLSCYCGTCPHLTVTVCTCDLADEIKANIQKMIDAGQSEQQIIDSFVAKYGPVVLATPPKSGFNLTAWAIPIVAFFGGLGVLIVYLKKQRTHSNRESAIEKVEKPDEQEAYYRDLLKKELERQK
jgi:cytochrome c-type biogenesis protein CcmH